MSYEFRVTSKYDEVAYKALAEASWMLFRKHRMVTQAFPVMLTMAFMIAASVIFRYSEYGNTGLWIGGGAVAFLLAAMPLSVYNGKRRIYKKSVKEAQERGLFPVDIEFFFRGNGIYTKTGEREEVIRYSKVTELVALGEWRFIFFGVGAYIVHASGFEKSDELTRFDRFLVECTGRPFLKMKRKGPQR